MKRIYGCIQYSVNRNSQILIDHSFWHRMPNDIIIKSQSISCYSKSPFILITMQSTARDFLIVHCNKTAPWETLHKLLRLTSQLIGKTKETSQVRDSILHEFAFHLGAQSEGNQWARVAVHQCS